MLCPPHRTPCHYLDDVFFFSSSPVKSSFVIGLWGAGNFFPFAVLCFAGSTTFSCPSSPSSSFSSHILPPTITTHHRTEQPPHRQAAPPLLFSSPSLLYYLSSFREQGWRRFRVATGERHSGSEKKRARESESGERKAGLGGDGGSTRHGRNTEEKKGNECPAFQELGSLSCRRKGGGGKGGGEETRQDIKLLKHVGGERGRERETNEAQGKREQPL